MGLLTGLLSLPVRGPTGAALWIARQIAAAAEAERNDPAALRAALAEAERRLVAGELSEEDYDRIEDELLARLAEAGR
ncbi:gas vesicle protein GvpG [Roseivivax isoporae]|uniref:Gas vesicle protein n=1 Tax=Roseivivax isoporae LMG 25204 TaxID=1449351 RepID=X7FB63_9RHOB|nr:gas vesicle protein GvpG [Roseivivax isoporae]ETX29356.1 gas vesicle protein [Roseivivax isoporae LMG 25204]